MSARDGEAGFTLIEALVAMAVLAVGAVGLLAAGEMQVGRITAVEDRTIARWVAENRLAELRLGLDATAPTVSMMGRDWGVRQQQTPTSDPDLVRVELRVGRGEEEGGAALVTLNGYLQVAAEVTR